MDQSAVIDQIIEQMKPNLSEALRMVLQGAGIVSFVCFEADTPDTGVRMSFKCFVAQEMPGMILQGAADGVSKSQARANELNALLQKRIITQ